MARYLFSPLASITIAMLQHNVVMFRGNLPLHPQFFI